MGEFMHERRKLLGLRLSGQQSDSAAVAHAESGCDVLTEDKLDALCLDERKQAIAILAHIAVDLAHRRKFRAFGLAYIEDIGRTKPYQDGNILPGDVLLGLFLGFALHANDGGKDADAMLALLHAAA